MWWQAPEKPFTQLEARRPQSSEACARPLDTNHADVQFCLFTPLPPSPSLFPSLSAFFPPSLLSLPLFLFFPPTSLWHALTLKVFSSSFEVCFRSRAKQLIYGIENGAEIWFVQCTHVAVWLFSHLPHDQLIGKQHKDIISDHVCYQISETWMNTLLDCLFDWLTGCISHS